MTSPRTLTTTTVLPVEPPHPEDRYITCGHDDDTPTLIIHRDLWDDLGHPRCVTLTIHPGDTLNP